MPSPTVTVEIGFNTDPFTDPTTWTDVTAYVALEDGSVQIERGRADAQSAADAGTCTFVLNNDDKRFTPGYTGGPYGAGVKVGKRVRVTVTHNANTYRRFTGYITSYDLSWASGVTQQSRVVVTAVDVLGMLSQVRLRNIVEHTFLLTDPVAMWPLDDGEDSEDAHEITGYRQDDLRQIRNKAGGDIKHGGVSRAFSDGDVQFGESKGLPAIPNKDSRSLRVKSPRKFESIYGWTALGNTVSLKSATTTVATGYWINFDQEQDEDQRVFLSSLELSDGGDGLGPALATGVDTKGRAFAGILLNSGTITCKINGRRIVTGGWHFIVAEYTSAASTGVVTLWVDGKLVGSGTAYGANPPGIPANSSVTIGAARRKDGTKEDNNPANARFSYFGIWTDADADALDSDELFEAGTTGWDGQDRTSGRITRVLKWFSVPEGRRSVERGLSEVRIADMKSLTALEYINECVVAEQGFFFQAGDGTFTFHARDHRWVGSGSGSGSADPTPTTLVQDSFNRADGALGAADVGGAWTDAPAPPSIVSNVAHFDSDEEARIEIAADFDATWTWVFTDAGNTRVSPRAGAAFSYPDVRLTGEALGYTENSGTAKIVKTFASPIASGSIVRMQASAGRIRVWDDGALIADCGVWASPTATWVKFRQEFSVDDTDIDDLLVTDGVDTIGGSVTPRTAGAFTAAITSTLTLTAPSAAVVGDYALAVVGSRDAALAVTMTGWTEISSIANGTGKLWVFGRVWTGTDPRTVTGDGGTVIEGWGGFIIPIDGVPAGEAPSPTPGTSAAATTWQTPTVNTPEGGLAVAIAMSLDNNELALQDADGWYLLAGGYDYETSTGDDFALGLAAKESEGGLTAGPTWLQADLGPDAWAGMTLEFPIPTYSASAAILTWHHPDERFTTDVEQMINRVTVTHRGGEVSRADAGSRLEYGPRELSIDTQLSDRNQAKSIAEYVLKLRETMRPRLDAFTYDILTEPDVAVRDAVLGVELDELLTLTDLPPQAHVSSVSCWVEGISETLTIDEWMVTFATTPFKSEFGGYWVLGTSTLGTDTDLGY